MVLQAAGRFPEEQFVEAGLSPGMVIEETLKIMAAGQVPDRKYVIKKLKAVLEIHRLIGSVG